MGDRLEAWATALFFLSLSFTLILLCLPTRHSSAETSNAGVVVLVLGDIGRSPRMQYHALSIAKKGGTVYLVGYNDTPPRPELLSNPSVNLHALPPPPSWLDTTTAMKFLLFAPFKALYQFFSLFRLLLYIVPSSAGYIFLQNPPAIPTLLVVYIVGILRRQRVVIDWHNFGFSILSLKLKNHPIVTFTKLYEIIFGRGAYANFTVTDAMRDILRNDWHFSTPVKTLHDRPPEHFQPLTSNARAAFLASHAATAPHAARILSGETRLLISSTSWTADEDFSVLLEALTDYDRCAGEKNFLKPGSTPMLLAIITGRGPLRDAYLAAIEKLEMQNVTVESVWLEAEDYPKMIACADLGVSLHTSSSGVDLPMKVVDLFGVGVPVAAINFKAMHELVKHGENGEVFETSEELGELLLRLFRPGNIELERLQMGARRETGKRWDEEWDAVAAPVFGL